MKAYAMWLGAFATAGCSSSHPSGILDAGLDAGADAGAVCSELIANTLCPDWAQSCTLSHYDANPVFGSNSTWPLSIAIGSSAAPPLAIAMGTEIAIEGSDDTWTTENVTGSNVPDFIYAGTDASVSLGLAADGTRWLAMFIQGGLWVAHGAGSAWTVDELASTVGIFPGGGLVITSTGEVVVGYASNYNVDVATWTGSGSAWTTTDLVDFPGGSNVEGAEVALALDPATGGAGVALAWQTLIYSGDNAIGGAVYFMSNGSIETVDANAITAIDSPISLAFDSTGHPNIAYYIAAAGPNPPKHAVRGDDGMWTVETIPINASYPLFITASPILALAAGSNGELAAISRHSLGLALAERGSASGTWVPQTLSSTCGVGAIAFSGDQLEIADCDGVLTSTGDYPNDYAATCIQNAAMLCKSASPCPAEYPTEGFCLGAMCFSCEASCELIEPLLLCGNATLDPSDVTACAAVLGSGITCTVDSTLAVPSACQ